jgi:hypothetical protein
MLTRRLRGGLLWISSAVGCCVCAISMLAATPCLKRDELMLKKRRDTSVQLLDGDGKVLWRSYWSISMSNGLMSELL